MEILLFSSEGIARLAEHSAASGKRIGPQAFNDVEGERD
jgi:hypothetical protein